MSHLSAAEKLDLYEALMMEYATGALDQSLSMVVASHLTLSTRGRRTVALCESIGGAFVAESCEPVAMSERSLQIVMGRLDSGAEESRPAARSYESAYKCYWGDTHLPQPLHHHMESEGKGKARWNWIFPGVAAKKISGQDRLRAEPMSVFLVDAKPGARLPTHRHGSREITLVLRGTFSDENGFYGPGDLLIMDGNTRHTPVADKGVGCACIVATGDPIGLSDWLLRFVLRVVP